MSKAYKIKLIFTFSSTKFVCDFNMWSEHNFKKVIIQYSLILYHYYKSSFYFISKIFKFVYSSYIQIKYGYDCTYEHIWISEYNIISLFMFPLLGHRPSIWITHKVHNPPRGPSAGWSRIKQKLQLHKILPGGGNAIKNFLSDLAFP
jgi:hypothetical protein